MLKKITSILLLGALPMATQAQTAERTSALNGAIYAVISHTSNGAGGAMSFIRLVNAAETKNKFSITVVGSPSGRTYGTTEIEVPSLASPQYSLTQILTLAKAADLNAGDTTYSLYLQNPEHLAGYQHVVFNTTTRFLKTPVLATRCSRNIKFLIPSV